jgi:hypothetical protein
MNNTSSASTINTFTFSETGTEKKTLNNGTDFPRYTSKCIDHTSNNTSKEFSMMYFVNPYSDNYINIIHDPDGEAIDQDTGETIEGAPPPLYYDSGQPPTTTTPENAAALYNAFMNNNNNVGPQYPNMTM